MSQALSQIYKIPVQIQQTITAGPDGLQLQTAIMLLQKLQKRWNGQSCRMFPGKLIKTEALIRRHSLGYFLLFLPYQSSKDHCRSVGDKAELEELYFKNKPTWWKVWYPCMVFSFPNPIHSNVKASKGNSHGNLRVSQRWWHSLIKSCKLLQIKRCWPQGEG